MSGPTANPQADLVATPITLAMVSSEGQARRGMPLTFRLLLVLVAGALLLSAVVAFQGGELGHKERLAEQKASIERLAQQLAHRAGPVLEKGDEMRLAVLVAATADLGDCRVMLLDLEGRVLLDTTLVSGGKKLALLTREGVFHRRIDEQSCEVLAPVPGMRGRVGEVRLRYDVPAVAASFSLPLFGVAFLACLSLIALACAFSHHFASRVRQAAHAARGLCRGDIAVELRPSRASELSELHEALQEVAGNLRQGMVGAERGLIEMAMQLVDTIEHHSTVTPGHGERTRRYARVLGERLGLIEGDLHDLELAAQLHDLGKACVRPSVLSKSGPLDRDERASLREHPSHGCTFLEGQPTLREVVRYIRHHHERYDGMGYPEGLRGDRIPLQSRIISIADAYDQVTSRCIYGEPMGWSEALDKLREDRGTHFDPWLLDLFEEEIRKAPQPARPMQSVVISTEGVLPYKAAEETEADEDVDVELGIAEDGSLVGHFEVITDRRLDEEAE